MKFITFARSGQQSPGVWLGDRVVDLSPVAPTIVELIQGAEAALAKARELAKSGASIPAGEVQLLAPIPWPRKNVFCVGRNYVDHVAEGARAMGTQTKLPEVP